MDQDLHRRCHHHPRHHDPHHHPHHYDPLPHHHLQVMEQECSTTQQQQCSSVPQQQCSTSYVTECSGSTGGSNGFLKKSVHIFRQVVAGREDGARQVQAAQVDMEEEDEVTTGERGPSEP